MSLLSLKQLTLNIAGSPILDEVDWSIQPQQRIALVGRNGAGKSSLLKLIQGELVQDKGEISKISNLSIHGLSQDVPILAHDLVYDHLVKDLPTIGPVLAEFYYLSEISKDEAKLALCHQKIDNLAAWELLPKVEAMASRLGVDPKAKMSSLSGGMKRRVLLAAALIAEPNLLLLDEPTNHLDIATIEWLEVYLKSYNGTLIVVTHDRAFLSQVATQITEIDRAKLHNYACNYDTYLERRDARILAEDRAAALFDKRLAEEETWIRTGIKARRTRNEGRVRALKAMREAFKARRSELGSVNTAGFAVSKTSGSVVFEVTEVSYQVGQKKILDKLSLLLTRGDKLGILGPNGSGKTTLIRLLLEELKPLTGTIKRGTGLTVAYFDQLRRELDENLTVMQNVAEGADYVNLNGQQKHVASYLADFLFSKASFNQKVSSLSGGEKNRLLLAKLLAKPANLLIMDEPTNDLDIDTLELLEKVLVDYRGTLIIISHDRAFVNQVVTNVLVWEREGHFAEYVGGYDDYRLNKKNQREAAKDSPRIKQNFAKKLSYNEQRELAELPKKIEKLEENIALLQQKMNQADFYQQASELILEAKEELQAAETLLAQAYERWEILESRS